MSSQALTYVVPNLEIKVPTLAIAMATFPGVSAEISKQPF